MEKENKELLKAIGNLLDEKFDKRFEAVDKRFEAVDKRFDEVIDSFGLMMESQTALKLTIENDIRNDIDVTNHTVMVLANSVKNLMDYVTRVQTLEMRTNKIEGEVRDVQYRVEKLSGKKAIQAVS